MQPPPALIIGFTIHGLALARSLHRLGVPVHAFLQPGAEEAPCGRTRFATVHIYEGLNTSLLLPALEDFSRRIPVDQKVVLFPTSDRIVRTLAEHWDSLSSRYLLSWSHCRELVRHMQLKSSIPALCERTGVPYPRSHEIHDLGDCERAFVRLSRPIVVKPALPLSSFKAVVVNSRSELELLVTKFSGDLPFVAQEWIDGGDGTLYACTAYLNRGQIIDMFTSRKLAALPPGTGQGTVFESVDVDEIRALTARFLSDLDLSGPVAVEFKRDADDRYWLIEPNVGRTEYCVDLAIQCGFDLPQIEYHHACGEDPKAFVHTRVSQRMWFDTDKDPGCFLAKRALLDRDMRPVFPYVGHGDWGPVAAASTRLMRRAARGSFRAVVDSFRRARSGEARIELDSRESP